WLGNSANAQRTASCAQRRLNKSLLLAPSLRQDFDTVSERRTVNLTIQPTSSVQASAQDLLAKSRRPQGASQDVY
ncbi:MAG: hypothetical protein Q8O48_01310, partial [Anaerolineales bacterium]|nr:hypothetical protein [Anaerolineales bacterium]